MNRAERLEEEKRHWQEMRCYEDQLLSEGYTRIAGLDEAGRGPLAGPVTAAAVILPPDCLILGLDDSKKLSEKKRLRLEEEIKAKALAWCCASVDPETIDAINILEASRLAMQQAVNGLTLAPQYLLIDALQLPLLLPQQSIIKGDAKSVSIAAASILAKNARDRMMVAFDAQYPGYGFARHKGYPTAAHKQALRDLGYTPIHRRSFKF